MSRKKPNSGTTPMRRAQFDKPSMADAGRIKRRPVAKGNPGAGPMTERSSFS